MQEGCRHVIFLAGGVDRTRNIIPDLWPQAYTTALLNAHVSYDTIQAVVYVHPNAPLTQQSAKEL